MMVLSADRQRVKTLLTETITLLCKNGLHFKSGFSIEALIGITLDEDDVFLVSINETVRPTESNFSHGSCPSEFDKRNHFNCYAPSDQESFQRSNWEHEHQEVCADLPMKVSCCTPLPSVQDRTRSFTESHHQTSKACEQSCLRTGLKRRFSESSYVEDNLLTTPSKRQQNVDSVFHASTGFNEKLPDKDSRSSADSDVTGKDLRKTERLSASSNDLIEVKQEPDSDDDDSAFQGNDSLNVISPDPDPCSSHPQNFSQSGTYSTWSNHAQPDQPESTPVVKPKSSAPVLSEDLGRAALVLDPLRPHRCSKCNRSFTTVQGRNLHEKLHDGIYQYNCPYCGKGCSGTTQLRGHMATHTQVKEFKCPICGQAYVYKKTLTDHIKRLHMNILSMPIM